MVFLMGQPSRQGLMACAFYLSFYVTIALATYRVGWGMLRLTGANANSKLVHVSKQGFKSQKLSRLQVSNCVPIKYKAEKPMFEARRPRVFTVGVDGWEIGWVWKAHSPHDRPHTFPREFPSSIEILYVLGNKTLVIRVFSLKVCSLTR